jgi:RNA polymerase sigma-70 factor, ECF subfamily
VVDLETLLARCGRGDELAWEELVRRFEGRVYGFALHYLRDPEEARDAAQEIFVKMYQHLGGVRDGGTFLPWMLRLARNGCIDRIRSRKARGHELTVGFDATDQFVSGVASPEDAMLAGARRSLLHRALRKLSASNREILQLKEIQQLKLEEISTLLDLPVGTIKSRSNRARTELAKAVRSLEASPEVAP